MLGGALEPCQAGESPIPGCQTSRCLRSPGSSPVLSQLHSQGPLGDRQVPSVHHPAYQIYNSLSVGPMQSNARRWHLTLCNVGSDTGLHVTVLIGIQLPGVYNHLGGGAVPWLCLDVDHPITAQRQSIKRWD